jgi:hypothetical protein
LLWTASPVTLGDVDELISDATYVIGLCDRVLNLKAKREHRFDFLLGDPGKHGRSAHLPVDGYYDELKLVVEYREKQHTESVAHFDKPEQLKWQIESHNRL